MHGEPEEIHKGPARGVLPEDRPILSCVLSPANRARSRLVLLC